MATAMHVIHNIPSPYRLHLFSSLNRALVRRGASLHVHFMASGHHDRPQWPRPLSLDFPHTYWRDLGIRRGARELHFNPGMICHLGRVAVDMLLVGGPYDTPTGLLATALCRARKRIAWIEPNTRTPGLLAGPSGRLKRWVLRRYDYVAVPGVEGHRWVKLAFGSADGRCPRAVTLPNLVDETRFRPRWEVSEPEVTAIRAAMGVPCGNRMALWPARLIPSKGVVEFLQCLDPEMLSGWTLLILGGGPLEGAVLDVIRTGNLGAFVHLVPYVGYEAMPLLYAAADLFVLPSLRDPCPLSVVEASHCGLPLLLSDRVGNYPEALAEGSNGWGLDTANPGSVRRAAEAAFCASAPQLAQMGRESRRRAERHWETETAVNRFLSEIGV